MNVTAKTTPFAAAFDPAAPAVVIRDLTVTDLSVVRSPAGGRPVSGVLRRTWGAWSMPI